MHAPKLKSINRRALRCVACGERFPVRRGRIEILVGLDGRLYCYATKTVCAARAIKISPRSNV